MATLPRHPNARSHRARCRIAYPKQRPCPKNRILRVSFGTVSHCKGKLAHTMTRWAQPPGRTSHKLPNDPAQDFGPARRAVEPDPPPDTLPKNSSRVRPNLGWAQPTLPSFGYTWAGLKTTHGAVLDPIERLGSTSLGPGSTPEFGWSWARFDPNLSFRPNLGRAQSNLGWARFGLGSTRWARESASAWVRPNSA